MFKKGNENDTHQLESSPRKHAHKLTKLQTGKIFEAADADGSDHGEPKSEKHNNYLPLQEYIEMMKDMRDVIHLHKDHMFNKLTGFYLSHAINRTATSSQKKGINTKRAF